MGFRCGIVGAPNVGKSTLFNALTRSNVAAENFPFCTIEENIGKVAVPDSRLHKIAEIVGVDNRIPTTLEFVDIAGLVEGASEGEGLGNQFLSVIREMDLIAHVIAAFNCDPNSTQPALPESVLSTVETVNLELVLADLKTVSKSLDKSIRRARTGDKEQVQFSALLKELAAWLETGRPVREMRLDPIKQSEIQNLFLLTAKPMFYILNLAENQIAEDFDSLKLQSNIEVMPVCAQIEAELAQLSTDEQNSFREELGIDVSALDVVIRTGYSMLGLLTFFTFNESEVRAWTVPKGTPAQVAAGLIHTDMERGFIRAEVMSFDDLHRSGSEQAVKTAGLVRIEGKSYEISDGDIVRVRFQG